MDAKKNDQSKPPLAMLPTKALVKIARVLEFGAAKYGRDNWRGGMDWTRMLDASLRHITAYMEGEDCDPETGLSHIAHAACCLLFLLDYEDTHREKDDRPHPISEMNKALIRGSGGPPSIKLEPSTETYIRIADKEKGKIAVHKTIEMGEGLLLFDYDIKGNLIGVEVVGGKKVLEPGMGIPCDNVENPSRIMFDGEWYVRERYGQA